MPLSSAFGEPALVRVRDGRSLYRVSIGTGSPTVVFAAGLGANRGTWGLVQSQIGALTRTLAYDRAGLGRSEPRDQLSLTKMVDDFEDLLRADGESEYILVGHSLSGVLARELTRRCPSLVSGLVLVDPVAEGLDFYHQRARVVAVNFGYRIGALLGRVGILQAVLGKRLHKQFSSAMRKEMIADELSPGALTTAAEEVLVLDRDLKDFHRKDKSEAPLTLPVTVISAGKAGPFEGQLRQTFIAQHRKFVERLPHGRHVIAEKADHLVPLFEPEIIVAEVSRLVQQVAR